MTDKDVVIIGGLVLTSVIALTLFGGKIKSFFKIMNLENTVDKLEDKIVEVKETRSEQYAGLGVFYTEAVDQINSLNQTVSDLKNQLNEQAQNAAVTVSDNLAGETITDLIKRSAEDTIAQVKVGIRTAGGTDLWEV